MPGAAPEAKADIKNVRVDALRHRTRLQRLVGQVATSIAHPKFLVLELVLHIVWVACNAGLLPEELRWDPYPFPLLTGFASTQALFITLLILMHAEHEAHVAEIREEMELQVSLHAEHETSKVLRMLAQVHVALGIRGTESDEELRRMSQPLDPDLLKDLTERHIEDVRREVE